MANSVPTLTGLTTPVTFLENTVNGAAQIIDADVTFTDPDNNFSGGTLTVGNLLAQDTVAIRNQGTSVGQIGVSGGNVTFGGILIGSFAGGAGGALTVTFNAGATAAGVEALIENLTYANSSDTPTASRSLELKVSDAAGFAAIAPIAFAAQTGAANPFNGVDVGDDSNPIFADLDGDGDLDAVVGEQNGTLHYFENTGSAIAPVFTERTGAANPFDGVDVGDFSKPIFADLDGDGDLDAVVGAANGTLRYFQNTGSAIAPAFTEQTGIANPFNGFDVGGHSTPRFADLDGDGDLDAIVGAVDGTLHYFENTGSATTSTFTEQTGADNPFNGVVVAVPFGNSAPSFADLDGDGDLDAIVGDFLGNLHHFENTGSTIAPAFSERTGNANPFNGVDVGGVSKPSFADLDGDGDLDAVVGEDDGTLNYFRNTTPHQPAPDFAEQTGAANPFNGVDVGTDSTVNFADLDGDGDLDALVGGNNGTLRYFENTGSAIAPAFTEHTGAANPFNTFDVGGYSTPSFADLDGDGDLDAIVGSDDDTLHYFENTGSAIAPAFTERTGVDNPLDGINLGSDSAPTFADLDGDGDLDAVFGAQDGTLRYFQNTGSATAPAFTERTGAANPFNGVDVGSYSFPSFADLDGDGDLDAIVGKQDGSSSYFENTGTANASAFVERTGAANPFNGLNVGANSTPTFADLDGDGHLNAVIGAQDGNLNYFRNTGAGFALVVDVTAQNDAPVAGNDAAAGNEDTASTTGNVLANDTDVDSTLTAASISGFSQGAHGAVVHNGDGTFTYTPNADFNGTDSFTYTLNDGAGGSNTATVDVTVTAIADIVNDTATINEDTQGNILVLANDTFEGTPAITGTTNGANGSVALNDNGTPGNTADDFLVYTPNADFNGADSFTYTVTSGGVTETATVDVIVTAVADIADDTAITEEDTSKNIMVLANDTFEDTPAITNTTNGANGSVALNDNGTPGNTADDFLVYTPNADFNGADSFTYTVTSGGVTETATVDVIVTAVADIADDTADTRVGTAVNVSVLANDTFEGTPAITGTTNGAKGTAAVNNNGTPGNTADDFLVYTPNVGAGPDSFTYTVTSGGVTETATVNVRIGAPVNDFGGDGHTDILWRDDAGVLALWQMDGSQIKDGDTIGLVDPTWQALLGGDFDGDGKADILWRNSNGHTSIWEMDGAQIKQGFDLGIIGSSWHAAEPADFDGDGKSDILWRNDNGQTTIWEMDGGQIKQGHDLGVIGSSWHVAGTADFGGDGMSDILWRDDSGHTAIWEMDGGQIKQGHDLGVIGSSWDVADVFDFDGDSKNDILWRDDSGLTTIWEMDGGQIKQGHDLGVIDPSWDVAATGDFGGDGNGDILWRHDSGLTALWEMDNGQVINGSDLGVIGAAWHVLNDHIIV